MTLEDIGWIRDKLDKLEEMLQLLTQKLIKSDGKLDNHLETSDERIRHWEKQFDFIQAEIKTCKEYIHDQQSKIKAIEGLATALKWFLGISLTALTLYSFLNK